MFQKVLILGAGGHGWQSLSDFIVSGKNNIQIYSLTTDFGGSSGIWNRLLEYQDQALYSQMSRDISGGGLTWGDFNKLAVYFLNKKRSGLGDILDFRSDELELHLDQLRTLGNLLELDKDFKEEFVEYFVNCFNYFKQVQSELNYDTSKKFCLGYVWQQFVWEYYSENINFFYHEKEIYPKYLDYYFVANCRQNLRGMDSEKIYNNEEELDHASSPINPSSLKVLELNQTPGKFGPKFFNDLQKADKIIIPTGSIANWLPFFNYPEVRNILRQKTDKGSIIWLLNLVNNQNEEEITTYIKYILDFDINPVIITAKKTHILNKELLANLEKHPHINYLLDVYDDYKYNPVTVSQSLENIFF